jgi:hypothetical protein
MTTSSNIQQGEHSGGMVKQESTGLTSTLKMMDLGGQVLASPVHFYKGEDGGVMGWDGRSELSDSCASNSPATTTVKGLTAVAGLGSDNDIPKNNIKMEWVGTSQFFVEQNLSLQKEVLFPQHLHFSSTNLRIGPT